MNLACFTFADRKHNIQPSVIDCLGREKVSSKEGFRSYFDFIVLVKRSNFNKKVRFAVLLTPN
jgi:hypothetical protein